jgi:ATP-dependent Lhr-like helicase
VKRGLHTLYISPLKALAVDIARNLERPIAEMALPIRVETRTGDTSAHKRARQIERPPDILLTTPEQLSLLLAHPDARAMFGSLRRVILDELHSLVTSKRGDLLSLGLARLYRMAPALTAVGLSATVREPDDLRRYLVPQPPSEKARSGERLADLVVVQGGARPDIHMLEIEEHLPLAGHTAALSMPAITTSSPAPPHARVRQHAAAGRVHPSSVVAPQRRRPPIALHHGSLDVEQRRRVEAAMGEGRLKGVVCTSTLDSASTGATSTSSTTSARPRGRPHHAAPSAARTTAWTSPRRPTSCHRTASRSSSAAPPSTRCTRPAQDTPDARIGALDVLSQHVLGMACAEPFSVADLYEEVRSAAPYADLTYEDFEAVVDFGRDRRLRATRLRALRQDRPRPGRALGACATAAWATVPAERRHHRRGPS